MPAINFPNSPTNGQSYTEIGKTWIFTGGRWIPQALGGNAVIASDVAPVGNFDVLWLDTNDMSLNIWYEDADSSQWIAVSGPRGDPGITVSATAPTTPFVGQLWFDIS